MPAEASGLQEGQAIALAIRPEKIALKPPGQGRLDGTIANRFFLGSGLGDKGLSDLSAWVSAEGLGLVLGFFGVANEEVGSVANANEIRNVHINTQHAAHVSSRIAEEIAGGVANLSLSIDSPVTGHHGYCGCVALLHKP